MNDDPTERLVERHLDGWLTPGERTELDHRLASDPAAARRFVEMARLDEALYRHFREARAEAAEAQRFPVRAADAAPGRGAYLRHAVDHLWGPAVAVLAHAALVLLLLRWAFLPSPGPTPPITVTMQPASDATLETPPAPLVSAPADPAAEPLPVLVTLRPRDPDSHPHPASGLAARLAPRTDERMDFSPPPLPAGFAGRSLAERRKRLARVGGMEAGLFDETAEDALADLARVQLPNGGWAPMAGGDPQENTALALLAFLSRGHGPGSPVYGTVVEQGLRRMVAEPAGTEHRQPETRLLALAEAHAISRIPALANAARHGAGELLSAQHPDGGWHAEGESPAQAARRTAWAVHALTTLRTAGLAPEATDTALAHAVGYIKTRHDPARNPEAQAEETGARALRTAAAWRVLQLLGEGRSPEARRCESLLRRLVQRSETEAHWPMDALHESALALLGSAEPDDTRARSVLRHAVAERIRAAAAEIPAGSRVQSASLAALTLGAPYRYEPITPALAFLAPGAAPTGG